jgi:hypothetical protein
MENANRHHDGNIYDLFSRFITLCQAARNG